MSIEIQGETVRIRELQRRKFYCTRPRLSKKRIQKNLVPFDIQKLELKLNAATKVCFWRGSTPHYFCFVGLLLLSNQSSVSLPSPPLPPSQLFFCLSLWRLLLCFTQNLWPSELFICILVNKSSIYSHT